MLRSVSMSSKEMAKSIKPQVQRDKARNHAADEHGNLRIGSQPHNAAEHYRRKQAEGEHPVAELRLFFRFLCHNANPHAPRTGHSKKRPHALLAYASFSHFPYMFALQRAPSWPHERVGPSSRPKQSEGKLAQRHASFGPKIHTAKLRPPACNSAYFTRRMIPITVSST